MTLDNDLLWIRFKEQLVSSEASGWFMKRQQGIAYQFDLFPLNGDSPNAMRYSANCDTVCGANERKESQVKQAGQQERALANCNLMQVICSTTNIRRAYKRVKQNKGVAGIDQMAVDKFADWFKDEGENLIKSLQSGMYEPNAVKLVEIPKPDGGTRMLGIPMVRDRIIQQAMNNNWFEEQGLYNLAWHYERFKNLKKPPCAKACTVV